jgi:hypothetical protein
MRRTLSMTALQKEEKKEEKHSDVCVCVYARAHV